MRVAVITMTMNDDERLEQWVDFYRCYGKCVSLHIIVDNASSSQFRKSLINNFPDSHIIFRDTNGGCTSAYNDGIKYALARNDIDFIMLLANDILVGEDGIRNMVRTLEEKQEISAVCPVLINNDTGKVEDFGCGISYALRMIPKSVGLDYKDVKGKVQLCDAITGGANLARREFYQKVGLQDELLFMYSDEVDMGIRASRRGLRLASVGDAIAHHRHIFKNKKSNRRDPQTKYLMGRNKVYLAIKHYGLVRGVQTWFYYVIGSFCRIILNIISCKNPRLRDYSWVVIGSCMGLVGNMKNNRFTMASGE
jgi:hypothetical protein